MEPRFGHEFSNVRVHDDAGAADSADAIRAQAYTVRQHIAFARGAYNPGTPHGLRLLAHELIHTMQQGEGTVPTVLDVSDPNSAAEAAAGKAADMALSGTRPGPIAPVSGGLVARQPAGKGAAPSPWIKTITVNLTPPEGAVLAWQGAAPSGAPGQDSFVVSTGKGYRDPDDEQNACTRACCEDAAKQCSAPHNRPAAVGSCCTPKGSNFWTGITEAEHNGYAFWTHVEPIYATRGIALHQYPDAGVTGNAIGHGCIRMNQPNAERIGRFKRSGVTKVVITGDATPVSCPDDRKCQKRGQLGSNADGAETTRATAANMAPDGEVPGSAGPELPEAGSDNEVAT